MKYPLGIQSFSHLIEDGCIYIDKTALVYKLIEQGKWFFLSRPRRFGKSLLISTFEALFEGKKELFTKGYLRLERFASGNWKHHQVSAPNSNP